MDIEIYLPCQPYWICRSLMYTFYVVMTIAVVWLIGLVIREYVRIRHRAEYVQKLRKLHYKERHQLKSEYPMKRLKRPMRRK
ncbi:hypothetical protein [Vibrio mangrovi]|uniref:Uncharacterized protein n=1 Tax=Vibrio mangrovi TaxID=474394 RepID=A0A1Y6IMV6_9VIBR|nr:hypothetical protein [Vibrio mangrovi]MDW6004223.1 hypothetical protein [Vibrio mangrovi]SMR98978.1 hypothetical protein VIM7927_00198 [Vibrio mangrovi]